MSRDRVLRVAVAHADAHGIDAVSMRSLAHELSVVPMALYKHVANKDELLDGMIDVVVGEIAPPAPAGEWRQAVRAQVLAAREVLLRHRWAATVIAGRERPTLALLAHLDSLVGLMRSGGLSVQLTHHAMHALGSRALGFTDEPFDQSRAAELERDPDTVAALAAMFPHIAEIAGASDHDDGSTVAPGCDDQFEFEFALDLLLDGVQRLHEQRWTPPPRR